MSFPYPTLSCFLRPGHPFGYPPVSAFCTQSLDGNGKFPAPSCSLPGCRASSKGHLELSTNPPRTPPPPSSKLELTTRREGLTREHKSAGCSMLGPPTLRGEAGSWRAGLVILQHGALVEGWPWG